MATREEINTFAREKLTLFTDPKTPESMLENPLFGVQCRELGFVMDGGRSFMTAYSADAYDNAQELARIVTEIQDPVLLGSAVLSRWQFITQWSMESLLGEENRSWFITALGRMVDLTRSRFMRSPKLLGPLRSVTLVSNNQSTGRRPTVNDQTEQQLTIHRDGRVTFAVADFGSQYGPHKIIRRMPSSSVDPAEVARLLDMIAETFPYAADYTESGLHAEPGMWRLIMKPEQGQPLATTGVLGTKFRIRDVDLSDRIRALTGNFDLFAFDGNPDYVNRIEFRYRSGHRDPVNGEMIWNYHERFSFDRRSKTAEHILENSPGQRIRNTYYVQNGVEEFLDSFDELSFRGVRGNPADTVDDPGAEIRAYEIGIYTRKGRDRVIRGTYDRRSLPSDWDEFMEKVLTFFSLYGFGQVFDPDRYARAKRRKTDHTYLSVVLQNDPVEYVYLADSEPSLHVDDFVVVPAGKDNAPAMAQITAIMYGSPEESPHPFRQLKQILRRAQTEDFRLLQEEKEQPE